LKILYHHRTQSRDGQAVHIEELIHALRERGCEVIVVEPPGASETTFGGESRLLPLVRRMLPKAAYELLEFAHNFVTYRRLKRAYLKHRPDVLYERHNLFLLAGSWLRRRHGVPHLLEINSPLFVERREHGGLSLHRLAQWTECSAWRTADVCLPVTGVLGKMIEAEGVPAAQIEVIPNGINLEVFDAAHPRQDAKKELGLADEIVLGFTGFVRDWHRLDWVIDFIAAQRALRCVLLVVGDGPERAVLEAHADKLGVRDRVRFTGIVPRSEVVRYISAYDVALQPAATLHASPLKMFEYMAVGCAIVAPDQPNIREIVEHDKNALLFNAANPKEMADCLLRLASDEALRARLGAAAKRTLHDVGYTWLNNADRVIALAKKAIAANKG
jgi:glycosyltransferase involved in cell wall biosynthesis